jgi:hypothetical protein
MNEPAITPRDEMSHATREEMMSALFANMVMQQINLAMMLLGKVAHPETGQFVQDLDTAQMFIDQLEMIEAKTRGNLTKDEAALLQQGLMSLRMAFVEAVNGPGGNAPRSQVQPPPPASPLETPAEPAAPAVSPGATPAAPATAAPEESRKKFSKKY